MSPLPGYVESTAPRHRVITMVAVSRQRVSTPGSFSPGSLNPRSSTGGSDGSGISSRASERSGSAQIGTLELVHAWTTLERLTSEGLAGAFVSRPGKQAEAAG